jgi:hypothetical protein
MDSFKKSSFPLVGNQVAVYHNQAETIPDKPE